MKKLLILLTGFASWRLLLVVTVWLAGSRLPLQEHFLGGGKELYRHAPQFWAWVNFDGEHFLAIAREGYKPLTYFFFPLYPLAVKVVAGRTGESLVWYAAVGQLISNGALLIALAGLSKLVALDYTRGVVKWTLVMVFLFPMSFYLISFYSESLFLALVVWAFLMARRKKWWMAGLLTAAASATRVVGVVAGAALLVEYLESKKYRIEKIDRGILGIALSPLGLIIYLGYLWQRTGDPLEFLHTVEIFGAQRSSEMILLPQVFYRYLFKIIPNLSGYWPTVWVVGLELAAAIVLSVMVVVGWWKLRRSYWVYLVGGYVIPTLSGSFSSLPRYMVVLFPAYILMAQTMKRTGRVLQGVIIGILLLCLVVSCAMFARGYWVA